MDLSNMLTETNWKEKDNNLFHWITNKINFAL